MEQISFDEFKRMDLRVGQVLNAERVEGTQKLLKLEVDIGTEKRQMIAGVAEVYSPETLVGKRIIVVANLKPATIRGIESQGMLLAADLADGKPIVAFFGEEVPVGTKVR
jgi:methionyl-tRNA synthetase